MDIDIANTLVEHARRTDWIEHVITFISVFLGAFLAYRLNLNLEMRKAKRQMQSAFCMLSSQMWLNLDEMLDYKKNILDKIKIAYGKNDLETILLNLRGPMVSFDFDMNKHIFLNDCNRCFIPELKIIQASYNDIRYLFGKYSQLLFSSNPQLLQGNIALLEERKRLFLVNYELYNKLCIRLYYLDRHFDECYKRFFNVNYYDDNDDKNEAKKKLEQIIPDALMNEEFIKLSDYFDKYWAPDYTLCEVIKFKWRKLKYYLKGIKIYFFGHGKVKHKDKRKR